MITRMLKLTKNPVFVLLLSTVLNASVFLTPAHADRLKDIANLEGVQANQLVGVGLVTGLDGTGDQTTQAPFTAESFRAYLNQFGIPRPQGKSFQLNKVAVG